MIAADAVSTPIAIADPVAIRDPAGTPMQPSHDAASIGGRRTVSIECTGCFHSGGGAVLPLAPVVRRSE